MAVDLCDQFPKLPFGNLLIYIPSQDNFDTKQKQTPKLTGSWIIYKLSSTDIIHFHK